MSSVPASPRRATYDAIALALAFLAIYLERRDDAQRILLRVNAALNHWLRRVMRVLFFAPGVGALIYNLPKSDTTPMITSPAPMTAFTIFCRSDSVFLLGHR